MSVELKTVMYDNLKWPKDSLKITADKRLFLWPPMILEIKSQNVPSIWFAQKVGIKFNMKFLIPHSNKK